MGFIDQILKEIMDIAEIPQSPPRPTPNNKKTKKKDNKPVEKANLSKTEDVPKPTVADKDSNAPLDNMMKNLNENDLIKGIVLSEILSPPISRRKRIR